MTRLSQDGVFDTADKLYRHMNPEGKMDTPNTAYILTEKWYKEYIETESPLEFFEWCLENKGMHVKKMQPVAAVEDDDGHWYVIPAAEADLFCTMLKHGEADEYYEFNQKFSRYTTGGSLNNIQLHAEI